MNEYLQKQFVPIEQCIKLRDIGFNDECVGRWGTTSKNLLTTRLFKNSDELMPNGEFSGDLVAAPIWGQIFDWFSRIHKLHVRFKDSGRNKSSVEGKIIKGGRYDDTTIFISSYDIMEKVQLTILNKIIELIELSK